MSENRFTSITGALRYGGIKGLKIGVSSDRIPMIEFESEEVRPCVWFLRSVVWERVGLYTTRVMWDDSVRESCERLAKSIRTWVTLVMLYPRQTTGFNLLELKEWWWKKKTGGYEFRYDVRVGDKSVHVIGPGRFPRDVFRQFYQWLLLGNVYSIIGNVDERYLQYVNYKGYATLRMYGKEHPTLLMASVTCEEVAVKRAICTVKHRLDNVAMRRRGAERFDVVEFVRFHKDREMLDWGIRWTEVEI